ncbi:hypothetical protein M422DRAFT_267130 [Sphaerobolus stellatus SS14]|uniref:Lipoprotein n=1 Tax=Sphaerobolus stellatus (strain SS14) TaxID=990650 RepID=A0A0C9V158_SPHS4|nr:hypothetical protein M422DRAFT_267130 [Sphaerobolus stellatus SS14]
MIWRSDVLLQLAALIAPPIAGCAASTHPRVPPSPARPLIALAMGKGVGNLQGVFRLGFDISPLLSRHSITGCAFSSRLCVFPHPAHLLIVTADLNPVQNLQGVLHLGFDASPPLSRPLIAGCAATSPHRVPPLPLAP